MLMLALGSIRSVLSKHFPNDCIHVPKRMHMHAVALPVMTSRTLLLLLYGIRYTEQQIVRCKRHTPGISHISRIFVIDNIRVYG
jgi:hypothetical protein